MSEVSLSFSIPDWFFIVVTILLAIQAGIHLFHITVLHRRLRWEKQQSAFTKEISNIVDNRTTQ